MVCAFIAAAFVLRPNSSLAGVLGSSGLASAGSGRGLRLPLSCAHAMPGAPIADTSKTLQPRVFRARRAIIMGTCLGLVSLFATPATPTHTQRNAGRICQTPGQSTAASWQGFDEFPLSRETMDA